jgi:FixJ family two-component response regulator
MSPQSQSAVIPIVAVVDEDSAVCSSLKFALELDGFAVRAYRSAAEFLHAGDPSSCHCLIIDQNMPVMNGMDLIAILRQRQIFTPVILVTGRPSAALNARAASAAIPIVEKPFLGNALVDRIREACQSHVR